MVNVIIVRDEYLVKRGARVVIRFWKPYERGYLPVAVLNFLLRNGSGISGFQPSNLHYLDELIQRFDVNHIGTRDFMIDRSAFDTYGRLAFRSTHRETLLQNVATHPKTRASADIDRALLEPAYIQRVIDFISSNEENFAAFDELVTGDFSVFFGRPSSAAKLLERFDATTALTICDALLKVERFDIAGVKAVAKKLKIKPKEVMAATRCALIDSFKGPPVSELFGFFSDDECRTWIQFLRELLKEGTVSAEAS
uniref:BTB domain-containing protein n=1 Tax=Panagrellus redivivus TaxID=6233 RepID=A0A7E4ZZR0_PANRE